MLCATTRADLWTVLPHQAAEVAAVACRIPRKTRKPARRLHTHPPSCPLSVRMPDDVFTSHLTALTGNEPSCRVLSRGAAIYVPSRFLYNICGCILSIYAIHIYTYMYIYISIAYHYICKLRRQSKTAVSSFKSKTGRRHCIIIEFHCI